MNPSQVCLGINMKKYGRLLVLLLGKKLKIIKGIIGVTLLNNMTKHTRSV